jgi:tRNA threonylcarbamoyladenosine biosynthesis protein TsaE
MPDSVLEIRLRSLDDTEREAKRFASNLRGGETIVFSGELGAGKTTFIRFVCKALGSQVEATSPTYVLEHEYPSATFRMQHWDVYRLKELPDELLEEPDTNTIRFIEWGERFSELLERSDYQLSFTLSGEQDRMLTLLESKS